MNILPLALAPILSLQSAGETAVAIKNDTPETWVIEYPRIISPFVQDYRRCLNVANRRISGEANFEIQHRADIKRCEEVSKESQEGASQILSNRGGGAEFTPKDVASTFDHIGRVHIARGADLDKQFRLRLQGVERAAVEYERNKPKGLVIELRDASVVKARAEVAGQKDGAE